MPACAVKGCSGDAASTQDPEPDAGALPTLPPGPQTPPTGQAALEAWLAQGHHKSWTCETVISPRRLNGSHGRHRVCSNQLLIDSTSGPYPVGAASVKELFESGDLPNGFAVGLKVVAGPGNHTWYWYERTGRLATLQPLADGVGAPACGSGCHVLAPRDNVFIRAQ